MRFEARRLALDTFVKIHLEHIEGARLLLMNHLRMMFTLSLGAVAGLITLYASVLRFGGGSLDMSGSHSIRACFAVAALVAMVVSALLSAAALQRASSEATKLLRNPFPDADAIIESLFDDARASEVQIMHNIIRTLDLRVAKLPTPAVGTCATTMLMVIGIGAAGASFLV